MNPLFKNPYLGALVLEPRLQAVERLVSDLVAQAAIAEPVSDPHICSLELWDTQVFPLMLPLVGNQRQFTTGPEGPVPFRWRHGRRSVRIVPPSPDPELPILDPEMENWLRQDTTAFALEDVWLTRLLLAYPCLDPDKCPATYDLMNCPRCTVVVGTGWRGWTPV